MKEKEVSQLDPADSYAKDFIKDLMANKSKSGLFNTGLFTSTRININSTLDDIIINANREDKVTRCRLLCLKRGWFYEICNKLVLNDDAPAPVKDSWNRVARLNPIGNDAANNKPMKLTTHELKERIIAFREFTKLIKKQSKEIRLFNRENGAIANEVIALLEQHSNILDNQELKLENPQKNDIKDTRTSMNNDSETLYDNLTIILSNYPTLPENVKSSNEVKEITRLRIEHHALFLELAGLVNKEMQDKLSHTKNQISSTEELMNRLRMPQ